MQNESKSEASRSGNWVAIRSGVGSATIKRYELQKGIPVATTKILLNIKSALEQAGIQVTGDPQMNPGVTLNLKMRMLGKVRHGLSLHSNSTLSTLG